MLSKLSQSTSLAPQHHTRSGRWRAYRRTFRRQSGGVRTIARSGRSRRLLEARMQSARALGLDCSTGQRISIRPGPWIQRCGCSRLGRSCAKAHQVRAEADTVIADWRAGVGLTRRWRRDQCPTTCSSAAGRGDSSSARAARETVADHAGVAQRRFDVRQTAWRPWFQGVTIAAPLALRNRR